MLNARSWALIGIVLAAAAARLVPHPDNVTPIGAMALFGGAYFGRKWAAFAMPLAALLLSDVALGLVRFGSDVFAMTPYVYGCFVATTALGLCLRPLHSPARLAVAPLASLASSVLFFLVTNFGSFVAWYPRTWDGLVACYVAGLPFFKDALAGDAVSTVVLFGGFALAERYIAVLREQAAPVQAAH